MHSLWLTFDAPSNLILNEEIKTLSNKFGGPIFQPHLTLVGEIEWPLDKIEPICERLLSDLSALSNSEFPIASIGGDRGYFMSLFLALDIPNALQSLREQLASALAEHPLGLDPAHVSVAYGAKQATKQQDLMQDMQERLIGQNLKAAKIDLIRSSRLIPIEDWKVVRSFPLLETASLV